VLVLPHNPSQEADLGPYVLALPRQLRRAVPGLAELRGPLADVLRVFAPPAPADSGRVEVLGEADLLSFWVERVCLR